MENYNTDWLFEKETIAFLKQNEDATPESLLLSKALSAKGWDTRMLARQLKGKKVARQKFPFLYQNDHILYPVAVSLEQASSEVTARFKAGLVKADKVIDLSGGMGIDTYFFSTHSKEVLYIEPQEELVQLAQHNFNALKATHIECLQHTAASFLQSYTEPCDLVYIDPSRRKEGQRLADYKTWEPDIVGLKPVLWNITKQLLIKLSPMTDISAICKELGEVKEVYVVSDRNECKEVLLLLEKGYSAEPKIQAAMLHGEHIQTYDFYSSEEQAAEPLYGAVQQYVYEPDAALLKAGAFKKIAVDQGVRKIHPHTHIYTSEQLVKDFPGKIFQVQAVKEYSRKNVEALIGKDKNFHVLTRNATVATPELVKTQHKLIERGDQYLLIFKGGDGLNYVVKANRLL